MRIFLLFCLSIFFVLPNGAAQISGRITDAEGVELPYATIYVMGTSTGTVSNELGYYTLDIKPGTYQIAYQYVGYKQQIHRLEITASPLTKDVVLEENTYELETIQIEADAEDPAYAIMRKAISKRDYYRNQIERFEADLYIKGRVKVLDAPESFLGQEIGDMEGLLDSTGQGLVYLSESLSKVYFKAPDVIKEEMISSVVAGDDSGFNINQFSIAFFDIYKEHIRFDRSLVSPLADVAMTYYKFKLLSANYDQNGRLINNIQVIPKSTSRPLFHGNIYIVEDSWNVYSIDLHVTGKAIKNTFFDTISFNQIYVPLEKPDTWRMISQVMQFKGGFFAFKMGGAFTYIFSNYDIQPDFTDDIFDSEIFQMREDALEKDSSYWSGIRPIPLTLEEEVDYVRKDSLKLIWESQEFLDSIDRENNSFGISDLLFGYSHNNSFKNRYIRTNSPLTSYQFNAVEGHRFYLNTDVRYWNEEETKLFRIRPEISYGTADEEFKASGEIGYRFDPIRRSYISLTGGRRYTQFDEREPVTPGWNTWYSLLGKNHHMKLYQKDFIKLQYQMEITNGLFMWSSLEYAYRSDLNVNTNTSIFNKDEVYEINIPVEYAEYYGWFDHYVLNGSITLRWRPGQKYMSYAKDRVRIPSKYPDFILRYDRGFRSESRFDKLSLRIRDRRIGFNIFGYSSIGLEFGAFLNHDQVQIQDFFHFLGNEEIIAYSSNYLNAFKIMPYYDYSWFGEFFTAHYEHHFDGYITDKIPLINKTSAKFIVGYSSLHMGSQHYYEASFGVDNFGIGPLTLFRMDYVWSFNNDGYLDRGFRIGLSRVFED